MREVITEAQLSGWMEWAKIRGPVGGPRRDWYHANLTMHAGKPYPADSNLSDGDFLPYWAQREAKLAKEIAAEVEAEQTEE